jgi:hypothetical protein
MIEFVRWIKYALEVLDVAYALYSAEMHETVGLQLREIPKPSALSGAFLPHITPGSPVSRGQGRLVASVFSESPVPL